MERTNMNNILITSAGKRVSLVKFFQKELKEYCKGSKVYTTEMNPKMSPASHISDGCIMVSRVTANEYISELLNICLKNYIKIVIPTIDTELIVLAKNKELFKSHGIDIIVSDLDFIETCRDKRNTYQLFDQLRIDYPKLINKNSPTFPMFAKPYDGSLSSNLHIINSIEDFTSKIKADEKLIYMKLVDKTKYKEYTVDMYYGMDNKVKSIVPRERIEVRAGEINKGITRKNFIVNYLKNRMGCLQGVIGCICIQLFVNEETEDILAIEINPRFGGGYPLSYYAGANYPQKIIEEYLCGQLLNYDDSWTDNTLMLRYDAEVIIKDN
jgi:carbamoyl-phosphate synthase large subunit